MVLTHNHLKIRHHRITIPRLAPAFESFRIVQLSDLHFYEYTNPAYYQSVVEQVNELAADAIFLTGDVVHYGNRHLSLAESFLNQVTSKEGRYAVLGNHDYHDSGQGHYVRSMLERAGYELVINRNTRLTRSDGSGLWIAGVDDYKRGKPDIHAAMQGIPSDQEVTLMLSHNPLMFDSISRHPDYQVDLMLSGHTHAGHVYIPVLYPIYRYILQMKYRHGLFERNGTQLYVTSGIGSAAFYFSMFNIQFGFPRFRYNTHPEIAVLELTQTPHPQPDHPMETSKNASLEEVSIY